MSEQSSSAKRKRSEDSESAILRLDKVDAVRPTLKKLWNKNATLRGAACFDVTNCEDNTGILVYSNKKTDYGYRQMAGVGHNNIRVLCHVLVWYAYTRHMFEGEPEEYDREQEISHLCGNGWCINPLHLVQEARDSNLDRQQCVAKNSLLSCTHVPKCIGHKRLL